MIRVLIGMCLLLLMIPLLVQTHDGPDGTSPMETVACALFSLGLSGFLLVFFGFSAMRRSASGRKRLQGGGRIVIGVYLFLCGSLFGAGSRSSRVQGYL